MGRRPKAPESWEPERAPEPQPSGSLVPPRRGPPTAVGTAAPRPHPHPLPSVYTGRSRIQRVSQFIAGISLTFLGAVLGAASLYLIPLSVALAYVGLNASVVAVTGRGLRHRWSGRQHVRRAA